MWWVFFFNDLFVTSDCYSKQANYFKNNRCQLDKKKFISDLDTSSTKFDT